MHTVTQQHNTCIDLRCSDETPSETMDCVEVDNDRLSKEAKFKSRNLLVEFIIYLARKLYDRLQEKYREESKGATRLAITYIDIDDVKQTIYADPLTPHNLLKEENYISYFWHEVKFEVLQLKLLLTLKKVRTNTAWQDIRLVADKFTRLKETKYEYSLDTSFIDLLAESNSDQCSSYSKMLKTARDYRIDSYLPKPSSLILPEEELYHYIPVSSDVREKISLQHKNVAKKSSSLSRKRSSIDGSQYSQSTDATAPKLRQTRIDDFFKKRTIQNS